MTRSPIVESAVTLGAALAAIVAAFKVVLRLPGIPYNVRELFLDHASTSALVFFALTLLWIGVGAMLVAQVVISSRRRYLALPAMLIAVSLISKMLLSRSVTYESIDDIIGSNNLYGLVVTQHAWGPRWVRAFNVLGPNAIDFLERRVRYTALYSIPALGIALSLLTTVRSTRARMTSLDRLVLIACAAAWLVLARTLVVTYAATDNLTELIAQRALFGIPGEWFLFGVPLLIGVTVALLLRASTHPVWWPAAIVATVAAIPAAWALLNLGLEPHVEKYGAVFSGAQFLLGPDRTHTLSQMALFGRWAAVQLAADGVTFVGAWIVQRSLVTAKAAAGSR